MSKYQLNIIRSSSIILLGSFYFLYIFVLDMQNLTGIILTTITLVIIVGVSIIISLKEKNPEKLKQNLITVKKYIFVILFLIISIGSYHLINFIAKNIKQADYEKKENLLQTHMDKDYWIINNLKIRDETLWHYEDYSHPGYRKLKEHNFILANNSPVDISFITLELMIYRANGEYYIIFQSGQTYKQIPQKELHIISLVMNMI